MEKEYPPFEYGIKRILDCGFFIEEGIIPENIQIGYGLQFLFDVNQDIIKYLLRADLKDGKTGATFMSGTAQTLFSVKNLSAFVDKNDKVVFPNGVLETLFGMSFTHLRALLAKNASGSNFANLLLPIINPTELFHSLIEDNIRKYNEAVASGDLELIKKERMKGTAQVSASKATKNNYKKEQKSEGKSIAMAPTDKVPNRKSKSKS